MADLNEMILNIAYRKFYWGENSSSVCLDVKSKTRLLFEEFHKTGNWITTSWKKNLFLNEFIIEK